MEDATISQINNDNVQHSQVTGDDLIHEIGKLYVDRVNDNKIMDINNKRYNEVIKNLHIKIKELNDLVESNKEIVKTSQGLHDTNSLYRKNNRNLDKSLVSERLKNTELRKKHAILNKEIVRLTKSIKK